MIKYYPLVSVVMPTRNRWDDLQKAIDSCLKQDYSPLEILIYDDASEPNIAEMVRIKYPDVKVYRSEENVGQVYLRNKGFYDANGEYIFSLDDDSYFVDSQTITKAVEILNKYPKVAVAALPYVEPLLNRSHFAYENYPGQELTLIYSMANFGAAAAAFRKKAIMESGGYCENFFFAVEEDDLSIRVMDRGWDIISIPLTPSIHLFSGIRDMKRLHILGPRNSILFTFLNVPMPYLVPQIFITTLGKLWHGIRIGEPILKLWGLIKGYGLCLRYWRKRNPVSAKTWKKFRRLLKQPEPYIPHQK